jgi:hypothetical protein
MAFDLTVWKERFQENIIQLDLKAQVAKRKSLYGILVASAFAPVVAAAQTGDPHAVMAATLALGGAVGGNLLANLIQKKQDAVDAEWSVIDPNEIAAQAADNPELRSELDAMLQKLDAVALAQQTLADANREWFTRTLEQEMTRLGNAATYHAVLHGDGAIAQGKNAVALGKGAVYVRGDNKGDINTGKISKKG